MPVTINGDGLIEVGGTSTTQGRVRLAEDTDNGSNYVELTAPASVTANRTVTFPDSSGTVLTTGAVVTVAQGGTGQTTLTANNVLLGNGTSAVQVVAPGASGNLLTSDGTTWTSAAPAAPAAPTTTQVLNATAGASAGAVGTYVWAGISGNNQTYTAGSTIAGSSLRTAQIGSSTPWNSGNIGGPYALATGPALSGTWRAMSRVESGTYSVGCSQVTMWGASLWLRIS